MPIPDKFYEAALDELEQNPFRALLARIIAQEGSLDKGKAKYLALRAKELWTEELQKAKYEVGDLPIEEEPDGVEEFDENGERIIGTIESPSKENSFGVLRLSKSEYQKKFPGLPYPFDEEDRNAPSF